MLQNPYKYMGKSYYHPRLSSFHIIRKRVGYNYFLPQNFKIGKVFFFGNVTIRKLIEKSMSSLRHLKAKSILLKISIFESLSKIMPSPDIKKFETCLYWSLWQYRVNE